LDNLAIPPIEKFVLNMSFGLVPCDVMAGLDEGSKRALIDAYYDLLDEDSPPEEKNQRFTESMSVADLPSEVVDSFINDFDWALGRAVHRGIAPVEIGLRAQAFVEHTGATEEEALINTLSLDSRPLLAYPLDASPFDPSLEVFLAEEFLEDDELRRQLESGFGQRSNVISVAAAGNLGGYGYEYPFAPAIFDNVVSVSAATRDVDDSRVGYSNPGEVLMVGDHSDDAYGDLSGTSFAAPKFSLLAAIYLLNGGRSPCDVADDMPPSFPALGYAGDYGPWEDLLPEEIAANFCPVFRMLVPTPVP
jgi:hypothetical protein